MTLLGQHEYPSASTRSRYAAYDRIMGNISWLLIALVSLDIKLLPPDERSTLLLVLLCAALLVYNVTARYLLAPASSSQVKTFIDLMVFLCFVVGVSWFTGKVTSPFVSLIYLVLMTTSLTQGRRITYFMAGLAVSSYVLLAADDLGTWFRQYSLLTRILELFPFMLIAHLGAMLSGEAEQARLEVERLSLTDEVTCLPNMRSFFNLAPVQERLARRSGKSFAICMLDADNLKGVNDRFGHLAGTELIRQIGQVIRANIRDSDIAARYGGDEFVILFHECTTDQACIPAKRIVETMAATPFFFEGDQFHSTISAGIASFPEDGDDVRTVMRKADEAMFVSKREGKNRLTAGPPCSTATY
ncbi:MAG TPA: GGDEF domain-containing protein [Geobacteraceae bacterium]